MYENPLALLFADGGGGGGAFLKGWGTDELPDELKALSAAEADSARLGWLGRVYEKPLVLLFADGGGGGGALLKGWGTGELPGEFTALPAVEADSVRAGWLGRVYENPLALLFAAAGGGVVLDDRLLSPKGDALLW